MKLSILIPMYNAEKYIETCLKSLELPLPEEEYEIIIIDDGSKDSSPDIVRRIQESRPNIKLFQQENQGAYATRVNLLPKASGTYLFNVDADDVVFPDIIVECLEKGLDEDLDFVGFETVRSDQDRIYNPKSKIKTYKGTDFIQKYPLHRFEIWWYIIKNDFVKKHGLIFSNNQASADVGFTSKSLLLSEKVGFHPNSGYCYQKTEGSIMRDKSQEKRKQLTRWTVLMIKEFTGIIEEAKKNPDIPRQVIKIFTKRKNGFTFVLLGRILKIKLSKQELQEYLDDLKSVRAFPLRQYHMDQRDSYWKFLPLYPFFRSESLFKLLYSLYRRG